VYDWWDGLELIEEPGYVTHLITKHAVRFIEEHKAEPFCVYIAHEAVHSPYQGPDDPAQRGPDARKNRSRPIDTKTAYRRMMEEMDRGVGDVLAVLERLELADNTLVFFFSDNGANPRGSNAPLRGFKGSNWEGGHREPAIARWPGRIKPGTVCAELCITLDVMPTMLALAGASVPEGHKLDGVNLAGVLLDAKSLGTRQLFWNGRAMRDGPWKLIVGGKGQVGVGLYHLGDDIGEKDNLAAKHPDRVAAMLAAIARWKEDVETSATLQRVPSARSPRPTARIIADCP